MLVLGIETTCDETAAAVVERRDDGRAAILANVVLSQIAEHAAFGGVVPEIAARAHVEALDHIIAAAMAEAGRDFRALDGVAAAAGPGLIGGVIVGLITAKAIALVHEKPLIAVNHLEAHALTARLTDGTPFPYCLFLASGGHTQTVAVRGVGDYVRLGTTRDDAIGEAFDKTAKLLGLGYPGGQRVEQEAVRGDPSRFILPRPMIGRQDADFSFSGLKTALRRCGKPSDSRGPCERCLSRSARTRGAAAVALHRQCRDDCLGRRGTACPRPVRCARHVTAGALAARASRQAPPWDRRRPARYSVPASGGWRRGRRPRSRRGGR